MHITYGMKMKTGIILSLVAAFALIISCGEDSTGPSGPDVTSSTLSLEFTGDSSKAGENSATGISSHTALSIAASREDETDSKGVCEVTASWTICGEAAFKSYVLYRSESPGISSDPSSATVLRVISDVNESEYVDSDVEWTTQYYYALQTTDTNDNGVWSNEDSISTSGEAPTASVLSADSVVSSFVDLYWSSCPDDDFDSYRLYRSQTPNIQSDTSYAERICTVSQAWDTTYTDDDVTPDFTYYYALMTTNNKDLSSWSNEITVYVDSTGGVLPNVSGLAIDPASIGRDVVLTWTAMADVDGYKVWFKATSGADWAEVGDVPTNDFTHTASSAGYYAVTAYKGTSSSAGYSNEVSTMPNQIMPTYTIWDNHAPADEHSAFIFGATAGTTGLAPSTSFIQDIYCYDGGWTQSPCGFYSGDIAPFGNGNHTDMNDAGSIFGYPTGAWWITGYILPGDVIFCELSDGHYVKVYISSVPEHPTQPAAHGIEFYYDYQPIEGLYLFTTESTKTDM